MSLADHERHGYALMKDIEGLSDGRVRLSTGTLYGALQRLLSDGWIERFEQAETSRDKQAYRLTATGLESLRNELERMKQLTAAGTVRLEEVGAAKQRVGMHIRAMEHAIAHHQFAKARYHSEEERKARREWEEGPR